MKKLQKAEQDFYKQMRQHKIKQRLKKLRKRQEFFKVFEFAITFITLIFYMFGAFFSMYYSYIFLQTGVNNAIFKPSIFFMIFATNFWTLIIFSHGFVTFFSKEGGKK